LLKTLDGQVAGGRNRRRELAEILIKWHDKLKHVNKTKNNPSVGMTLSTIQVADDDDRLL
jgi:hypothetical protein